ncbi:SRPBCC domain-containing protein [Mucilaginibacter myungsuensis]|uniref:SRPBCC domain-containing protein n=1 Tax=Mucilaginibacter myungsuensis TaxID=649104 RepID=A0A929PUT0_9SPHI|nr:SRPBCC domain-containing protein [Mucilaginibacter myungsuensis]MBE9660276.1 SRPBCC domain-containing protein [Mucilaginibacter myungsuensis]MDN3600318.1 SRPBCC domain-containing protein [Mucilaginibacter myungsuensis]
MKDYKKYYTIPATPEEIYLALTNPFTIELWTGEPAVMSTEQGTEFSMWDEAIVGKNIEFEENKKVVQQWYFDGQDEPSIVTIKLHADKQGSSVELRHTNIPDEAYQDITGGWDEAYMGGLTDFFSSF